VKFDPEWLEETKASDDFSEGLEKWTLFGAGRTAKLIPAGKRRALQITKEDGISDAVWNFPMTPKGKLTIDVLSNPGNKGINVALTDHFSVSFDTLASANATFNFPITADKVNSGNKVSRIEVTWDTEHKESALYVDNKLISKKTCERIPSFGLNYLRLGIPGKNDDRNGFIIKSVKVKPVR
jgi:hypothetical protein